MRNKIWLLAFALSVSGVAFAQTVDYSVVSVPEYGAQNEAYMSRSAEKWVRGLCFNELGVGG